MTPKPSDFPHLRRVLSGYLHEDFPAEYRTPAGALRAFQDDANAAERRGFAKDAKKFLKATEALDFDDVKALLARLGSRWMPSSRQALATLFETIDVRANKIHHEDTKDTKNS